MFNEENRLKAEIEKRDREIHQLKKGGATERPSQEVVAPVEQAQDFFGGFLNSIQKSIFGGAEEGHGEA